MSEMDTPPLPEAKPGFKLSAVSLFMTVVVLSLIFVVRWPELRDLEFGASQMAGTFVGAILFPLLFGWIAYRLFRRSVTTGNIVYTIFLVLMLLGQVAQRSQQSPTTPPDTPRVNPAP
jgi:MFS family permease